MIKRDLLLGKILDYKDKDIIKIISKIYFYNWLLSE